VKRVSSLIIINTLVFHVLSTLLVAKNAWEMDNALNANKDI
jgi:hypothetical protein